MFNAIWSLVKKAGRAVLAVFRPVTNLAISAVVLPVATVVGAAAATVSVTITALVTASEIGGFWGVIGVIATAAAVPVLFIAALLGGLIASAGVAIVQFFLDVLEVPFELLCIRVGAVDPTRQPVEVAGDPLSSSPIYA